MVDNKSNDRTRAAAIIKELTKNLHDFSEVLLKLATEKETVAPAKAEAPVEQKKKKEKKDPNAPKRNLSSYMIYSQEIRPDIVARNPELKAIDIAKLIGEMWNKLSDKEKQPYVKKAEDEKARFDKENEKYKASLGEPVPATPAKRKASSSSSSEPKKSKKSTESEKPIKSEPERAVKVEKVEKKKSKKADSKKSESKGDSSDAKKKAKKNK
ncbi:High mobility group NHP1 [Choanephora cucurbitarum]|uniref:High mobility group NHP1 n=1 Tax=Choanephora cucurbitarum TaxID=101091 RepID=A0A1C7N8Y8_9FUNG|nr:High mobility group NHP1 [Choanephora cucurbitarum]